MRYIFFLFLFTVNSQLGAQELDFDASFISLSEKAKLEIFTPVESSYRSLNTLSNPYQSYQQAIYSKREKLEMRYTIIPYDEAKPNTSMPNIHIARMVTSIAKNEEDSILAFHDISSADLEMFGADWGQTVFLHPKTDFATQTFCKVVTLYKEAQGTVSVFYLFNEADNSALDSRYFSVRFEE